MSPRGKLNLYQSILSRLAAAAPLFAKPLLDASIRRRGKTPESVTAIELVQILKSELYVKLGTEQGATNALVQSSTGFLITDRENRIVHVSPYFRKILKQLSGPAGEVQFEALRRFGLCEDYREVWDIKVKEFRPKGLDLVLNVSIAPLYDEYGIINGTISIIKDVTLFAILEDEVIEQNRLLRQEVEARMLAERELIENQQQMVQNSKLISLGEMAGGIAHEINNPLAIALSGVNVLELELRNERPSPAVMAEVITSCKDAIQRIVRIVNSMLALYRAQDGEAMAPTRLAGLIEEVLSLCGEKCRALGIRVSVGNEFNDATIQCRRVEIGQVLVNAINNSIDAIERLEQKWIEIQVRRDGDSVILSVVDSGAGVADEVQEKIFEPFFTTKEIGKGTGLGLSISRKIIQDHGGRIVLDIRHPNTKFDFILPLARTGKTSAG